MKYCVATMSVKSIHVIVNHFTDLFLTTKPSET